MTPFAQLAPPLASIQAPAAIAMVRPHRFAPDAKGCPDNGFTSTPVGRPDDVARAAYLEVTAMAEAIADHGVRVHLFEDASGATPDSVFPNNWFSTHDDGSLALYPMRAGTRRLERRPDIVAELTRSYLMPTVRDYTRWEEVDQFLEGTGAMVLDHQARIAYVARSPRASEVVLRRFCADHGYRAVVFDAEDRHGEPIYHTNVMMAVGAEIAVVCLESMPLERDRRRVRAELEAAGRQVVPITLTQVEDFAGNAIELAGRDGGMFVISARGWGSLRLPQRRAIESALDVLPVRVPTIEYAGGSARCMIAGLHAPARPTP